MSDEPLMGCALGLRADDLSAWRDGALDEAAKARLDAHISGCAACRARLAEYDAIAQALRAIPTPAPIHGFGRNPRRAGAAPTNRPTQSRRAPIGRRQALGGLGAVAAVALLLFAFTQVFGRLGVQSPIATATATSTALATATVAPTATATALPTLPTTTVAAGACGKYFPYTAKLTPAAGLVVTQYTGPGLMYPSNQIPSDQPDAPMTPPSSKGGGFYAPSATPIVYPNQSNVDVGAYVLAICNPSGRSHTISAVQVSLAKMAPFTDQLGAWEQCHDGAYFPVGGYVNSGGCGGADFENEYMTAKLASNAPVGASVTATQEGANWSDISGEVNLGPLPVSLKPGQAMTIEMRMTKPSAAGYYTYSFALTVDGASTGTVTYSQTILSAPIVRQWSGAACETSAMQALIAKEPTPTANTAYICPAS